LKTFLKLVFEVTGGCKGTIKAYLEKWPDANHYELLRGIARGLAFLHGELFDLLLGYTYKKCAGEDRSQAYDRPW
jgi:hypothetical protein